MTMLYKKRTISGLLQCLNLGLVHHPEKRFLHHNAFLGTLCGLDLYILHGIQLLTWNTSFIVKKVRANISMKANFL